MVIFDQMESSLQIDKGQHGKILKIFQENEGMEKVYVDKYDVISDIKFIKSKNENFLQIADSCAYNIFRQFAQYGREWEGLKIDKKGRKKLTAYSYFKKIRCNFFYKPSSMQVRGYGLVCIPDKNKINWNLLEGCSGIKKPSPK